MTEIQPLTSRSPWPAPETYGTFRLRAIGGGPLRSATLFRSCELCDISSEEALFLRDMLGIKTVYDIRNQWETAYQPQPYIMGTTTVALTPNTERRPRNTDARLVAGVIGEYGKPGERMRKNYARYAKEYDLIGKAIRSISMEGKPALVHCVNGKDRTGVLCAVILRLVDVDKDVVLADYLATNQANSERIEAEVERLGTGMTDDELDILRSFLEARPEYLEAFFDEIDRTYGSFEGYVEDGLHIQDFQRERLKLLLASQI